VSRYTSELSRALALRFPEDQVWLASDQPFNMPENPPENLRKAGGPRNAVERRWWLWGLKREITRISGDVFHGTDFAVPYTKSLPSVMTVHDLSPWMNPSWQPDSERVRKRTPRLLRYGFATMVITPSESVRRAAIDRFGLIPDRVAAVPLAASEFLRPAAQVPARPPYFLFVGTLEPRKNIARLLEAWREVRKHREVDLVLAGRARSDFHPPAPESGLRMLGAVPDEDLPQLYSGALAVVYPSLYEGFGLPVLEAMQCGAVVVTSRDPAISEVVGTGNAIQVPAEDQRCLAQALLALARLPDSFTDLRSKAAARAREFSWRQTAERTRDVYDDARRAFRKAAQGWRGPQS
jgi:glycosyltransferase involved in cell wall biosynthesis